MNATWVASVAEALRARGWQLTTAESCTGGLIAAACTDMPGSSRWFDRGAVTYSNAAKHDMLGVPMALIEAHGAVSESVALAMAQGALARSQAQIAVAVTGIAGPDGGSPDKPVGTVWVAWATAEGAWARRCAFTGGRSAVRQATLREALAGVCALAQGLGL